RCILAHCQRLFLPASNELECRLLTNELTRLEFHRLPVAGLTPGFQPDVLELSFDIRRGLLESRRADIASVERVVGEECDVAPPAFALGRRVLNEQSDQSYEQIWKPRHCLNGIRNVHGAGTVTRLVFVDAPAPVPSVARHSRRRWLRCFRTDGPRHSSVQRPR